VQNGRADRTGVRYDNALPLRMVKRAVSTFSEPAALVVDPFVGSGTTAAACWPLGRRFVGGDVNPNALRFTAARLLLEHAHPDQRQPALVPEAAPAAA
jgi:site-specific DNA-methyltransferase (adenine-specific)